ncbi:MAG: hypothetical protein IKM59_03645 [Oscillospiraceae bacterium]|nr:hypothetical protein [Oscillospiraceae bacterium]
MSKRIKLLMMIAALAVAFVIAFQAFTIYNTKEAQEEQFRSHIALAAQSFGEYKATGYDFMYEDALIELHTASGIARLLEEDPSYQGLHGVLLSIVGTHHSFPEDLALFTDELYAILNHFSINHDTEDLYTKLKDIDHTLTGMMMERAEKVE